MHGYKERPTGDGKGLFLCYNNTAAQWNANGGIEGSKQTVLVIPKMQRNGEGCLHTTNMAMKRYRAFFAALAWMVVAAFASPAQAAVVDWNDVFDNYLKEHSQQYRYTLDENDILEIPPGTYGAVLGALIVHGTCIMQGGALMLQIIAQYNNVGVLVAKGQIEADTDFSYFDGKLVCGDAQGKLFERGKEIDVEYHLNPDGGIIPYFSAGELVKVWFPYQWADIPDDLEPTKSGYTFMGWDNEPKNVNKGATITALWAAAPAVPAVSSAIPKTGDSFPFGWMACAACMLLGAAGLLATWQRHKQN